MGTIATDLQNTLKKLDAESASKLERLVRDAIALVKPGKEARSWPAGYFETTAGSFAGERFDLPEDPPPSEAV